MVVELCRACGKPKPSLAVEQGDEFCSTECARGDYGSPPNRPAGGSIVMRHASFRRPSWRRPSAFPNGREP